jgi:hypothetical protein
MNLISINYLQRKITDTAVFHAADMLGLRLSTKKEYFAPILGTFDRDGEHDDEDDDSDNPSSSEAGSKSSQEASSDHDSHHWDPSSATSSANHLQQIVSLYREIQSPMFWLPRSYCSATSSGLFMTIDNSDGYWDLAENDENEGEDENISTTVTAQLQEESRLDAADIGASEVHEHNLWNILDGTLSVEQAREKHEQVPNVKRQRRESNRRASAKGKTKVVDEPAYAYDEDEDDTDDDYVP